MDMAGKTQNTGGGPHANGIIRDEIAYFSQSFSTLQHGLTQAAANLQEKQNVQLQMMQTVLQRAEETARQLQALREEHAITKQQQAMQAIEMQAVRRQVDAKDQDLQRLKEEHATMKDLLEAQAAELSTARQFLSQTDPVSDAEVMQIVDSLNAEILQTSAILSESLPHTTRLLAETTYDKSRASRTYISGVDMAIRQLVYDSRNTPNPSLALQIALQAYLTSCCTAIIGCWHSDQFLNSVFEDLYDGMRQVGWYTLVPSQDLSL
jgi:myosin heavy subunit